ncbi:LIC_10450 family protein [Leptospira idonii]|uniref:Uncharacterized protein n=1 Tax=Leptospira idonii TaxID=1193500 RepID=A0A4R9M0B6_9LEPT|nr:hypothetical protein [Leptospira idonii]TGN19472.1 hypothetical protein EHS15_09060 [Leptospira idonii]
MTPEKGKHNYIRIGSITEIDPNKLSISQINQRYVDSDNNRYALRFNKETRRIEIIKIISNQSYEIVNQNQESSSPKQENKETTPIPKQESKVLPKDVTEVPQNPSSPPLEQTLLEGDIDLNIMTDEDLAAQSSISEPSGKANPLEEDVVLTNLAPSSKTEYRSPHVLVEHFIKVLGTYKERANAIIKNLQSSRIFEITGDPSENKNIVGNLAREMEAQVFEVIDKMIDLHKEMTSYPRPITYYISKAPADKREEMKTIDSDKEKLDNLHLFEMQRFTEIIVRDLKKLSLQLMNILNLKSDSQVKQLQYPNQLMYVDAKNASLYFSQDLDKTIMEVDNWKKQK